MNSLVREFVKNGKSVKELMEMPYYFVIDVLSENNKPKEEKSLISAFGG